MRAHGRFSLSLPLVAALAWSPAASAVTIDWTFVGNPGNACDTSVPGCFGTVAYDYKIATYEVTNSQYAEFLNAVADTDTNALYNTNMGSGFGGITRSGSSGGYSYSAIAGRGDMPVSYVSFYDSLRFANWLHNGQLTGAQNSTTTENGAYTITAQGISNNSITRNAIATVALPSEDEWFKAAYYDASSASYFDYPAGSNTETTCAAVGAISNTANCNSAVGDLTEVGSYIFSASPYGTFDQGGNAFEWNEAIFSNYDRVLRGGGSHSIPIVLAAPNRFNGVPSLEDNGLGFRVVPEPAARDLLVILSMLGIACLERRRALIR